MNDEMKKIPDEVFETAWKRSGTTIADCRYAACDAVLAAQQTPVPGQVTESQILAAQKAWHQAELDGRVSIDSRDELRSRKIIEVVAPYVQYGQAQQVTLSDEEFQRIFSSTAYFAAEPQEIRDAINKELLSRRAPAEPAVQPLPRVQGDPQFGRSSVEPEAARTDGELVDKMCREYYPHNIWGQLSRIEQGECRRNMTAALAAVRRAIEAQAREGYVPIEDVEKVFVRIPRASLRGRGSDGSRKSSQKD